MNWPLRKKLYAAFGTLIGITAVLGVITYARIQQAQQMHDRDLAYRDVALKAEQLMSTLLQSRRHEKDFFARGGDVKYEKLQVQRASEFKEIDLAARAQLGSGNEQLQRLLDGANTQYGDYYAAFEKAAALFKRRGTADSGLQKEFRELAHNLEKAAEEANDKDMQLLVLSMRRAEKDYLLRELPQFREALNTLADRALSHVQAHSELRELASIIRDYRRKFEDSAEAGVELAKAQVDLHDATEAIDTLLTQVHQESDIINERNAEESRTLQRQTGTTIITVFLVAIGFGLLIARMLAGQLSGAVEQLLNGTRRIAKGDLTANVEVATKDELGELAVSFNAMAASLRDMARNTSEASTSLVQVIQELQATVSEQGAALQQQASSVSETVATVEEMSRSSSQVTETAGQVLAGAGRSLETSNEGKRSIQQSVQGMHDVREQVQHIAQTILELSEKTQQIGTIIATVDDFAEQSSLLALNASIEAARAGEHGRAFGVVAGEVKNLAEQSQQATEKVRTILSEIQRATHTAVMVTEEGSKRVDRGVELVSAAGEIISSLAANIADAADSAKQIAAAARQQSNGVEQINVAVAGIDQFARQNLEAIKQTEATTQTLASVSKQLRSTSAQYAL